MKTDFSIRELLSKAWGTTTHNLGFLILLFIVSSLILFAPSIVQNVLQLALGKSNGVVIVLSLALALFSAVWLQPVIQSGSLQVYLNLVDGKPVSLGQLFSRKDLWLKMFLASLLYTLLVIAVLAGVSLMGFIIYGLLNAISLPSGPVSLILVVVGVLGFLVVLTISLRYSFYNYFLVDRNLRASESLQASWQSTKGLTWKLFVFAIVLIGLNMLGVLALGIGLLLTVPMSLVADTYLYRKIAK